MNGSVTFIEQFRDSQQIALCDGNKAITYAELHAAVIARCCEWQQQQPVKRPFAFLFVNNTIDTVVNYLAALSMEYVIFLLPANTEKVVVAKYQTTLQPNVLIGDTQLGWVNADPLPLADELCLLMSTSGSTGAGKCVALSYRNLYANCDAICQFLPILATDNVLLTMPLSYSYGLSVLHTHLSRGACITFTTAGVFDKAFWQLLEDARISSLCGVPSFYEMLLRMRITRMPLPYLRYFTQAGGKLAAKDVSLLADYAGRNNKQFFVMYGQTEATARMAYVPPETISHYPASIGRAIPGGELVVRNEQGDVIVQPGEVGELYYRGDNVMLGYVSEQQDLASFSANVWLATGDLATVDEQGLFSIVGRSKRMIKVAGERVNLDAIEACFADDGIEVKCTGEDNHLNIFALSSELQKVRELSDCLSLPERVIAIHGVATWPLLANGKPDYATLSRYASSGDSHD